MMMADCSIQRNGCLVTITALFNLMFVVQGKPVVHVTRNSVLCSRQCLSSGVAREGQGPISGK